MRRTKLESILRLFSICVSLLFCSRCSWFPVTVQNFCHLYCQLAALFKSSFYVFLIGNAIILSVYALSNRSHGKNVGQRDIYDEFVNNTLLKITADGESRSPTVDNSEENSQKRQVMIVDSSKQHSLEKQPRKADSSEQIFCTEVAESPLSDETVTAVTETTMTRTVSCRTTVTRTTNGEKAAESKRYRRVQSECFERRTMVVPRQELKRLTSEVSRETVIHGGGLERPLFPMETLSDEEFNRTVEDFIAKHKSKQWEEHREL